MSDKKEELLKHFKEITIEYHQHCEWTEDKYSAVEEIEQLIKDWFAYIERTKSAGKELNDIGLKIAQQKPEEDWLPTAENVNALPEPVRGYIHDIETNADPAGIIRENVLVKDLCKQLEAKLSLRQPKVDEDFIRHWADNLFSRYRISIGVKDYVENLLRAARVKIISDAEGKK